MNDELKAKYSRIANDPSQLEMFKNDQIDVNVTLQAAIEGNKLYQHLIKGDAIVGSEMWPINVVIVAKFSTPFTGISSGTLVGGGPLKQIVSINIGNMGNNIVHGICQTTMAGEYTPLDNNPKLLLWAYDDLTEKIVRVTPSFSSDTVTEL